MTPNTVHVLTDTAAGKARSGSSVGTPSNRRRRRANRLDLFRRTRTRVTTFALAFATVLAASFVFASGASALATHAFSTSFGTPVSDVALSLASNSGVAVNQTTHGVYVADTGNARVDQFSASGAFVRAWGWGVADGTTAALQTCTAGCHAGLPGGGAGQFTTPTFIAVDNSGGPSDGDVYVGDTGTSLVQKFTSVGALVTSWGSGGQLDGAAATSPAGPFGSLAGIAVDTSGDLFVYDQNANMFKFAQDGTPGIGFNSGRGVQPNGIAVDSTGNLYVVTGAPGVTQFTSSGTQVGDIDDSFTPTGIAVDPSTTDLYVDDGALIHHYAPSCNPAPGPCSPTDSFGSGHLSAAAGLAVDASSKNVYAADSGDQQIAVFVPGVVPDVTTGQASNLQQTTATLNGTVNPDATTLTDCHFEYVTDAAFKSTGYTDLSSGGSVRCNATPSGSSPAPVNAGLSALTLSTLYHFRLVAANANGANQGQDQTFVTSGHGFGITSFDGSVSNQDGSPATQAGSHPYEASTTIMFNQTIDSQGNALPDGSVKDIEVNLPAGFVGNPSATPKCTEDQLQPGACPGASQVGTTTLLFADGSTQGPFPVFNMVPPPGKPAQFGFNVEAFDNIHLDATVRTGGDYGLNIDIANIPQDLPLIGSSLTFWGVPADPSHDAQRHCAGFVSPCSSGAPLTPFLTLPTSCPGPVTTTLRVDSWQSPGDFKTASFLSHDNQGNPIGATGCDKLDFMPSISVQPDTTVADSPGGLSVDLHVPQNDDPNGLAEANLKQAVVTLPAGTSVNPAAADGLQACSPAQIDLTGPGAAACPDASKIGTVEVDTPLIDHPLPGAIYLAQQTDNPFGSLLAIYIAVDDPQTGIVVKLPGHVVPDPVTGQLTTTFDNNPQLPFSDFKLDFFGGPHAALATPETCGTFQTTSALTPWSDPNASTPATPLDNFMINSGANGSPCVSTVSQLPFAPGFVAGTVNPAAGAYSPFSVTFSRSDQDQELSGITVHAPPGLLGKIAGVPLCGEPQAAQGSCLPASQIGHVTVAAGAGPSPVVIPQAGKPQDPVYLTGPYKGAPFGLSVVVPAEAGPFNLGTVVVRAAINVDPHTSQITITSDPLPSILQGIPLKVRMVKVIVDREGFMFNPTSCDAQAVAGTITSAQGATVGVSSPFAVANCAILPFKPSFKVSTQGKASKADGASLDVKVTSKGGPQSGGGEANIKSVKVDLPKQLPSRLTTLQKACVASVFETNPAGCPKESDVGTATAVTPVLAHPLTGPAYLVSHGGAAFPDLEIVLQGEGITLILDGNTNIKKGITSSTFKAVPDAPVSSFELKLPTGKYSILGANGPASAKYNLCGQTLAMPTVITGQNGAVVKQSTKVSLTGCAQKKALTRAQKLAKALKACRKEAKGKRAACVRQVRKRYAPVKKGAKK